MNGGIGAMGVGSVGNKKCGQIQMQVEELGRAVAELEEVAVGFETLLAPVLGQPRPMAGEGTSEKSSLPSLAAVLRDRTMQVLRIRSMLVDYRERLEL